MVSQNSADLMHVKNSAKGLKPMGFFKRVMFQLEMQNGIYLLEWWEKLIFNTIVVVGLLFLMYTTVFYLPGRLQSVANDMIELSS
ncbi:hypothetical protein EV182_000831 [Spiromyces aspiralis]|uniref:Uncharacterized protein n=1 Tax=Spiromyces aspiralis TaxID=68401 RepID=A0ACC1HMV3_9FUNG|nr:hypothetical protein EV182_000831 [Spiromyces aspiralis]